MSSFQHPKSGSFKIDALGLITILGSRELDIALGTLRQGVACEALPTFAPYLAPGGYLTEPIPGFHLYNITDGIVATDISAWFSRWLVIQELTWSSTTLYISKSIVRHSPQRRVFQSGCSTLVSGVSLVAMLALAIFYSDKWAVANAAAMHLLGFLRCFLLHELRASMHNGRPSSPAHMDTPVKIFCTLPNGKAVSVHTTRSIVVDYLLTNPVAGNPRVYRLVQGLSWLCFVLHILALGMASLMHQILAVGVVSISTISLVRGVGVDDTRIANLRLFKYEYLTTPDTRSEAYARLRLSQEEEDGLVAWSLIPQKRNTTWWQKFDRMKARTHL